MKKIDVLKLIANHNPVPIIKIDGKECKYNEYECWFEHLQADDWCKVNFNFSELNDEVEVMAETIHNYTDTLPPQHDFGASLYGKTSTLHKFQITKIGKIESLRMIQEKINEIIDVINDIK